MISDLIHNSRDPIHNSINILKNLAVFDRVAIFLPAFGLFLGGGLKFFEKRGNLLLLFGRCHDDELVAFHLACRGKSPDFSSGLSRIGMEKVFLKGFFHFAIGKHIRRGVNFLQRVQFEENFFRFVL